MLVLLIGYRKDLTSRPHKFLEILYMLAKILFLASFCGISIHSLADVVYLANGDRISGNIQLIWGDKLIIEPEYSDPIQLDRENVVAVESKEKMAVEFNESDDDAYILSRSSEEGKVTLVSEERNVEVPLNALKRAEQIRDFEWGINLDLGSNFSRGNTDSQTTNLQWNGELKIKDHRIRSDIFISREEVNGQKTKAKDRMNLGYNYFFVDQWFLAVNVAAERDPVALLTSRYSLSPAIGYDFFDDPDRFFHVQIGAGYSSEIFNNRRETSTTIDWKLNFFWEFFNGDLGFFHDQNLFRNLDGRENFVFYSQTGFRYEITEDIYLNFQANFDYDSVPVSGFGEEDLTFIIGAGIDL